MTILLDYMLIVALVFLAVFLAAFVYDFFVEQHNYRKQKEKETTLQEMANELQELKEKEALEKVTTETKICVRCAGTFEKYAMKEVAVNNSTYSLYYCKNCAPPYDKKYSSLTAGATKYYKTVEVEVDKDGKEIKPKKK